jgi:hypothetical protein
MTDSARHSALLRICELEHPDAPPLPPRQPDKDDGISF